MNIKEKIEELVEKIKGDPDLKKNFMKEPIPTLEKLLGVNLPDEKIKPLIDGIKSKLDADELKDKLGDIGGKLGGLFGKK